MLTLTRKLTFTAGHIYRGGGLSDEELRRLFGIAAERSGHGHNYVLEVSVRGPVNPSDETKRIHDKCNTPNGHGHIYVAEVTVAGTPDPRTGVVIDLGRFEKLLKDEIDVRFDHKHMNLDTEFFKNRPATAENIAIVI